MDARSLLAQIETSLANQVALAGGDPTVEAVAEGIRQILEPAVRQGVIDLAEQAAIEVSSQLPGSTVRVMMAEGEPTLEVVESDRAAAASLGDYEARLTLRLPEALKELVDDAATSSGESVNSWVVKTLSSSAEGRRRAGSTKRGRIQL